MMTTRNTTEAVSTYANECVKQKYLDRSFFYHKNIYKANDTLNNEYQLIY